MERGYKIVNAKLGPQNEVTKAIARWLALLSDEG